VSGITVIIPTIGRDTLSRAVFSVTDQLTAADTIIVIADGEALEAWNLARDFDLTNTDFTFHYLQQQQQGHFGHPARNHVLDDHIKTGHVWTLDDDDEAAPGALDAMRKHMEDPWTIFKMHYGAGHSAAGLTLPNSHQIRSGNIGTPMIFAPLCRARFGHHYIGDLDYAAELYSELGEPVWADETVAIIRP
jgi:hypothetical protein